MTSATLQFPPGPPSGFTPTGLSGFGDLRPAVVVRELLQNSLDAANEANEQTARVHFRLYRAEVESVPGYEQYAAAFEIAVASQKESGVEGNLPDHAQEIVDTIEERLTDRVCDVLSVVDNGVGLDQRSMTALLSDGTSAKPPDASGSYGNGHMVTVPASDLRYVLYGGVRSDGEKIGAGHAILASHPAKAGPHPYGADGFLVCGFGSGSNGERFDFARNSSIPNLIADQVDDITKRWKHGAAVLIPWFNHFREDSRKLHEIVFKDAACNFFAAIEENRLEVVVDDRRENHVARVEKLTRDSLPEVLRQHQGERRSSFLRGKMARAAWDTIRSGEKSTVDTEIGAVTVCLRYPVSEGSPRVDLCRNGMWIVDDKHIPGFANQFGDQQPFHAVMLIDSGTGGELHRLIRKAEAPLHDRLSTKLVRLKSDRKKLRDALGTVRQWLQERVPGAGSGEYRPDDVLTIESRGSDGAGSGTRQMSFRGTPVEVGRRTAQRTLPGPSPIPNPDPVPPGPTPRPDPNPNPDPPPSPVERSLSPVRFSAVTVPSGQHSCSIRLQCERDTEDAQLSLRVDENTDVTCDHLWQDDALTITVVRRIDGPVIWEGTATAVPLGRLARGVDHDIEVTFEPTGGSAFGLEQPVIRVEVVSSKPAQANPPGR